MKAKRINRRDFLTSSSKSIVGAGLINSMHWTGDSLPGTIHEPRIKEFRVLGRTGFKVSDIGCGPISISNENVLKSILDSGVNFIDTAETYSNGNNELMIGRTIKDIDRKSVFINTKMSLTKNDTKETIVARVYKCLERLDTDYLDGLMLWSALSIDDIKSKPFHQAFNQLKSAGRVKFCGVSCHGTSFVEEPKETMEKIVCAAAEDGRFDMVLFVYNYVQKDMGDNILKVCDAKNVGALIMKSDPFGGAFLDVLQMVRNYQKDNKAIPESYQNVYDKIIKKQTDAVPFLNEFNLTSDYEKRGAAIGFVLDKPSVGSVLITFRNFTDVSDYVNLSGSRLTKKSSAVIDTFKNAYGHLYCRHACGLCESKCPAKIPVNTIMRYNHYFMAQSREKYAIQKYYDLPVKNADRCLGCDGFCEQACPYSVSIKALLAIAHKNLSINSI